MNVAFIVTSYWAYGELLIALHFAKRIKKAGYNPYFFIPPSHEKMLRKEEIPYTTLIPKLGNINRIFLKDYEDKYHPELVILADFINYYFCERHYGLKMEDLRVFRGRIGTFDDFDWNLGKRKMDTYGFESKNIIDVDVKDLEFWLAPCPIVNPSNGDKEQGSKICYSLVDEFIRYEPDEKERLRIELGLPKSKKIILVTSAVWQETYKNYPKVVNFVEAANRAYKDILSEASKDGILVYVGPGSFFGEDEIPSNVMVLNQLPPDVFEKYAAACDLVVSRNITSTTFAKLALSGIPAVMVKSSLFFDSKTKHGLKLPYKTNQQVSDLLDSLEFCYPYLMYPVGWHSFLKPVIENNPYMDVITVTELFDVDGSVESIRNILENSSIQASFMEKAAAYRKMLDALTTPIEALDSILRKKKPTALL
jgi:hypothetical protein